MNLIIISHHPESEKGSLLASLHAGWISPRADVMAEAAPWTVRYVYTKDAQARKLFREVCEAARDDTVLLFNGLYSMGSWTALIFLWRNARRYRLPQVVYWHDASVIIRKFSGRESGSRYARAIRRVHACLVRRFIEGSRTRHWAVSRMVKQAVMLFLGTPPEQVYVVGESIDLTQYRSRAAPDSTGNRPLRLCGAGDATHRKGVDLFVRLADQLSKSAPDAYSFSWFGAERESLTHPRMRWMRRAPLETAIEWAGWVNDFPSRLHQFDGFLLTSRDDPFPLVALEALATDLPVFAFDNTGTADILPREFVARDIGEMAEQVAFFRRHADSYPTGHFRKLVEPYDAAHFRKLTERLLGKMVQGAKA